MPWYVGAPVDLGPVGAQARGNELGRLEASSKIENSVVTTSSNNWYQSQYPRSEKAKPDKKSERHIYSGGTLICDYGGDCWGLVPHQISMVESTTYKVGGSPTYQG